MSYKLDFETQEDFINFIRDLYTLGYIQGEQDTFKRNCKSRKLCEKSTCPILQTSISRAAKSASAEGEVRFWEYWRRSNIKKTLGIE